MNLLLLPGLLCDRAAWAPMLPHVERAAECSVPDYVDEMSLGAMAERVLASAPSRFAVAGHSMGGRVALEIVRRAPERVERLALLDSGCHARPTGSAGKAERAGRLALLATARQHGMRAMARTWLQPMVHPERLADAVLIDAILDMFARRTPQQFAGQIDALLARPDATDVLRAVTCPALVLCGREDSWATPAQHEEMAALIPRGRLTIVERCGHMAPMERPEAVGAALAAFLQAAPDSSAQRDGERPDTTRDMIA